MAQARCPQPENRRCRLPRIVICDSRESTRLALSSILRAEGYDVVAVSNADAALQAVAAGDVGSLVLDHGIARCEGKEAVIRLFRAGSGKRMIVVAGSRRLEREVMEQADHILLKPIRIERLLTLLSGQEAG